MSKSMITGKRIKKIRTLTAAEAEYEGWDGDAGRVTVLELEDGTLLYPSRDEEGNGGGALFGVTRVEGQPQGIMVMPGL